MDIASASLTVIHGIASACGFRCPSPVSLAAFGGGELGMPKFSASTFTRRATLSAQIPETHGVPLRRGELVESRRRVSHVAERGSGG